LQFNFRLILFYPVNLLTELSLSIALPVGFFSIWDKIPNPLKLISSNSGKFEFNKETFSSLKDYFYNLIEPKKVTICGKSDLIQSSSKNEIIVYSSYRASEKDVAPSSSSLQPSTIGSRGLPCDSRVIILF
jgi:hypothetical protein